MMWPYSDPWIRECWRRTTIVLRIFSVLEQQNLSSAAYRLHVWLCSAAVFLVNRGSIFELTLKLHHDALFCVTKHARCSGEFQLPHPSMVWSRFGLGFRRPQWICSSSTAILAPGTASWLQEQRRIQFLLAPGICLRRTWNNDCG